MNNSNAPRMQETQKAAHKIELDHLHSISMTGVKDVPTFTDKLAVVRLDSETLQIVGQNMQVKTLDVESGRLVINGQINTLKYSTTIAPTSLIKRIFK